MGYIGDGGVELESAADGEHGALGRGQDARVAVAREQRMVQELFCGCRGGCFDMQNLLLKKKSVIWFVRAIEGY